MQPPGRDKRESAYRGMYLGGDESLTSLAWLDEHVRKDHGPLGAMYPPRTWTDPNPHGALKEGDTPSWLYFLPVGLSDPEHPEYGSWGGRFQHVAGNRYGDAKDKVDKVTDARATVWRWRQAVQNEFQARMDWCYLPKERANHPPVPEGHSERTPPPLSLTVAPGSTLDLDGKFKDPDGDEIHYRWFVYPEAGTYPGEVALNEINEPATSLTIPRDFGGHTLHVICEATDTGTPPLTRYRRFILTGPQKARPK